MKWLASAFTWVFGIISTYGAVTFTNKKASRGGRGSQMMMAQTHLSEISMARAPQVSGSLSIIICEPRPYQKRTA